MIKKGGDKTLDKYENDKQKLVEKLARQEETGLCVCSYCGAEYELAEGYYDCPSCGCN
jgi:rubrerythrin